MWLAFAILSMLAYASADIIGKRKVDSDSVYAPLELMASSAVWVFVTGLIIWGCGLGETGRAPWTILVDEPLLIASSLCFLAYTLLYLFSFRFVGLSVDAALGGMNGIVFFLGTILVNLVFGKLNAAHDMLHLARLIPILVTLTAAFVLPRLERSAESRNRTVVGMLILLLALVFDGADTLITAVVFDEGRVGPVDCMIASWFMTAISIMVLILALGLKIGRWIVPFRGGCVPIVYAVFVILASVFYLFASSHDAVRTGLVFVAMPIFTLVCAQIFLKERYTFRQNLCIWTIALATIAFCVLDRVI